MRYHITHVLEGMELHQRKRIQEQEENLTQTRQRIAESKRQRQDMTVRVAEYLADEGTRVLEGKGQYTSGIGYGDTRGITDGLQRLVYHVPSASSLKQQEGELETQQNLLQRMRQGEATTGLELFLRAMQRGGETHVSAHGVKQAGFDPRVLTAYVTAYATAHPEEKE